MGARDEAGLERRGREVHTAGEHGMEEAAKALAVAGFGAGEIRRRLAIGEEQPEHTGDEDRGEADAGFLRRRLKAPAERLRLLAEALVETLGFGELQGGKSCRHRHRIARKRARLIDGSLGRDQAHQSLAAAVGPHGQAAADDLAEGVKVGVNAVELGGAATCDPEAGHHLIEDEQRAMAVAERAKSAEKARPREDEIHVAERWVRRSPLRSPGHARRKPSRPPRGRCRAR